MSDTKTKDSKKTRQAAIEELAAKMTTRLDESETTPIDLYFTGLGTDETAKLIAAQSLVEDRDAIALPAMVRAIGTSILNAGSRDQDSVTVETSVMGKRILDVTVDFQKTDGGEDTVAVSAGLKTGFTNGTGDIRATRHAVIQMFNESREAAGTAIENAAKEE